MRTFLALAVMVLFVGAASAEDDRRVSVDIREPIPLEDFLKVVSAWGEAPLVWDGRDHALKVEVIGGREIAAPVDRFFEVVRALLFSYGFALAPCGPAGHEVYRVVQLERAHQVLRPETITPAAEGLDALARQEGRYVTAVLPARNLATLEGAEKALSRLVSPWPGCSVTAVEAAHGFVVVDFAPAVAAMVRALDEMDQGATAPAIATEIVPLEHARAVDLAAALEHAFGANQPTGLCITPDARSNQILLRGPASEVEAVLETVPELDVPVVDAQSAVWTHVVRLEHVQAGPTAAAIQALLHRRGDHAPATFQQSPVVVAHAETNALLVSATPRDFELLTSLLEDLDRPE